MWTLSYLIPDNLFCGEWGTSWCPWWIHMARKRTHYGPNYKNVTVLLQCLSERHLSVFDLERSGQNHYPSVRPLPLYRHYAVMQMFEALGGWHSWQYGGHITRSFSSKRDRSGTVNVRILLLHSYHHMLQLQRWSNPLHMPPPRKRLQSLLRNWNWYLHLLTGSLIEVG